MLCGEGGTGCKVNNKESCLFVDNSLQWGREGERIRWMKEMEEEKMEPIPI